MILTYGELTYTESAPILCVHLSESSDFRSQWTMRKVTKLY